MRMYSALRPPPQVVEELRAELDRLGAEGSGLRWEPSELWHITLAFYAEVDDPGNQVDWLRKALAGCPAPTVSLDGAGTFPGVLWLAVREGTPAGALAELAASAGAGREDRPYIPHLTLARARRSVPRDWHEKLVHYRSAAWTAREAVLMGKPKGGAYAVVERFPLGADRAG